MSSLFVQVRERHSALSRHLFPAALLALFVLALYFPLLFTNRVLASGDILHYFYPYRDYAAEALRQGRIPLWNPYIFLGAPFLANPQTAVLYPLHWPLAWLPVTAQVYWSVAIHTWLLGFGGYLLMRRWQMPPVAALTTGVVLAGSGFFGGLVGHLNQLNAAAWLPWGVWVIEGIRRAEIGNQRIESSDWRLAIGGFAALVALMLLAGHTQTAYINLFGIGVWALLRTIDLGTQMDTDEHRWILNIKSAFIRFHPPTILIYFLGCVLGGLIAAAQLLPTLEVSALGLRSGGLDYFEVTSFSLKPLQILWTLLPSYGLVDLGTIFGPAFTEYVGYVGVVGLLLAGFGAARVFMDLRGLSNSQFAILFTFLGLFLAAGRWNPLYYVLFKVVPGFDLFRVPARWMMLYTLGMAVLAGIGMGRLGVWERGRQGEGKYVITDHGSRIGQRLTFPISQLAILLLLALDLLLAARALPHTQTTAPQAVYDLRTAPAFLLSDPSRQLVDPAASGRFLSMSTTTFDPGDMGDYRRILSDTLPSQLTQKGFEQLLTAQKSQEILAPNLPLLWRVPAVDGFDGGVLPLQRYNQFLTLFIPPDQLVPDGRLREQVKSIPASKLLSLLNVHYVITDKVRDLWFEGVYYDRQIGARLTGDQATGIALPQPFEATHLDLIAFAQTDGAALPSENQAIAVVTAFVDRGEGGFILTVGGQPGAQIADGTLDSQAARASGATVAYRDVEGGKQEYRVRLAFDAPLTLNHLSIQHQPGAPALVIQAATLFDQRTGMFLPLLPSDRGNFRLVHSGDVKVYEHRNGLSRAFLVHDVKLAHSTEQALDLLRSPDFDPTTSAVVEDLDSWSAQPIGNRNVEDQVEILRYQPERIELRTQSASDALLVLSDTYYPGWRATVDSSETPIYPANHLFRGVPVTAGEHTVIFEFAPQSWQRGLLLSGVGGSIWLLLILSGLFHLRYRRS